MLAVMLRSAKVLVVVVVVVARTLSVQSQAGALQ